MKADTGLRPSGVTPLPAQGARAERYAESVAMKMVETLIYDVGMHNGDDTAYYLSLGYSVVAVEASPALAQQAKLRFQDAIGTKRLTILNIGIASEDGAQNFYLNKKNSVWNSFDRTIGTREDADVEVIKVRTQTIDQVMLEHGTPYYLKIDIEGNDILCLSQLSSVAQLPAYVSAEVNGIELLYKLRELGYTKFKLIDQFSLLPLELPPVPEYVLYARHKKYRESRHPVARLTRKLFGKHIDSRFDKKVRSVLSYPHPFGSSGAFGEHLPGSWLVFDDVLNTYLHYKAQHEASARNSGYNFWVDIHGRR